MFRKVSFIRIKSCRIYVYLSTFQNEQLLKSKIIIESTKPLFFSKKKVSSIQTFLDPGKWPGYAALRAASPEKRLYELLRHPLILGQKLSEVVWFESFESFCLSQLLTKSYFWVQSQLLMVFAQICEQRKTIFFIIFESFVLVPTTCFSIFDSY